MLSNLFLLLKNATFRQKWVLFTALLILLCFWLVMQHSARQGVARSLAEQDTSNAVLLQALEDTVIRSFQSVNSSMLTLAESIPRLASNQAIKNILLEQLSTSPQLRAIELLDAQGWVITSATNNKGYQVSYACLDTLNKEPSTAFVIESLQKGRYPNDPFAEQSVHQYIPICVPVYDTSGQLSKILVASINPQYFHNLFNSVASSLEAQVHLYRYDGEKLLTSSAIQPETATVLMHVKEKSWGQFRTSIAENKYLVSYRSTSLLPLILVLVSDEASALAAWHHDERMMHWFLLIMSIITLVVALVIAVLREKRRQALGDIHLLSTAIRSTANAILITNKEGNIHWTNKAFTLLTGYSFEEVKGKTPRVLTYSHHQAFRL